MERREGHGEDDDSRPVPPALIGPTEKLKTARKFTLIGNRRRPRKTRKKEVTTSQVESSIDDHEVRMGAGIAIEQPEQNDGARRELFMPNENVLPLHSNAVDDEDTDVGMHIIDGGDNDEEESDEQSECLPFSEIFTESLGLEEIYMIEILRAKSLVTLDDSGCTFLLQDFDFKTRLLKVNKFCIVRRISKIFDNCTASIYSCSCNSSRENYVSSLETVICQQSEGFKSALDQSFPTCCHIRVCLKMIPIWDAENNIDIDVIQGIQSDHGYNKILVLN